MSKLNRRELSLVSLGAALGSNCVPCIEFHIPSARRAGLSESEIRLAIRIADKVRQVPARAVIEAAEARIDGAPNDTAVEAAEAGCSCNGSGPVAKAEGVS